MPSHHIPTSPLTNANVAQQYLHELGADNLDAVDKNGYTAMMIASAAGAIESVKVLIKSFETARKVKYCQMTLRNELTYVI